MFVFNKLRGFHMNRMKEQRAKLKAALVEAENNLARTDDLEAVRLHDDARGDLRRFEQESVKVSEVILANATHRFVIEK
jgi:hypothetical protein